MAYALYFDINVHFKGKISRIKNVEPNRYSYIDLLDDVAEKSLSTVPCGNGYTITLKSVIPGSNETMVVGCDLDVLDMFRLNSKTSQIELFVELSDVDGGLEVGIDEGVGYQIIDLEKNDGCQIIDVEKNDGYQIIDVERNEGVGGKRKNVQRDEGDVPFANWLSDSDGNGDYDDMLDVIEEDDSENSDEDCQYPLVAKENDSENTDRFSSYESDNEDGRQSSDDDGKEQKNYVDISKFGKEFHVDGGDGEITLKEGLLFANVDKFREALKEYTIQKGCKIVRVKNEKSRVTCRCAALGCNWRIHASPLPDDITYKIRKYEGEHTCLTSTIISEANSTWICKKMIGCLRTNPKMTLDAMQVEIQHKYGVEASLTQLYRARRKALDEIEGNHAMAYKLLPTYAHESIDKVLGEFLPESSHRLCCRHLFANFKKVHPGMLLRKYFWEAARAYNQVEYQQAMERIKNISKEAHKWLSDVSVNQWARHAFDERVKNDHITNNLTESFNSWLGHLRHKPILSLLEGVRTKVMTRIQKRHAKASTWVGSVGPHVKKRLAKAQRQSRQCTLLFCGGDEYEIIEDGHTYELNMSTKACSCREWQIAGIPCRHAVAALTHKRANIEEGCDQSFMIDAYLKTHGGMIHPVRDQRMWEPV
ncbi:hypothetical protein RHGRI_004547 [Rhododendron griersonianum]|uniref:SWIM-type domain-containing protein n=1 Tax=Rhododendron griersonianum TaxID=479676 RepID=A0AAV6LAW4_9ERIC|nr:hypothetical protein RHGRI_004547 [Rhododendron griersonianum]